MGFKTGIIGLPNVGKSTLFNALTSSRAAQVDNYPFCTINANVGEVPVPDERLPQIATIENSPKITPARMTFVDIAGLVRGASKGEGLGNRFLANIREVDAITHVLRCFSDDNIIHVNGTVDPLADVEIVETELMLADIESIERQLHNLGRKTRGGDSVALAQQSLLLKAQELLYAGKPARNIIIGKQEHSIWNDLGLLTSKPVMYACNVDEDIISNGNVLPEQIKVYAEEQQASCVVFSAAIEEQISQLDKDEAREYLETIGCEYSGLQRLISSGYTLLDLITYFTVGPKEAHAWTVSQGTNARDAAGKIHGDFSRGFIRAETISYEDFVACNGYVGARESGKLRSEGKSYIVKDGDLLNILFNV